MRGKEEEEFFFFFFVRGTTTTYSRVHNSSLAESDAAQVVLVARVRLLSESGHGLPRVGLGT